MREWAYRGKLQKEHLDFCACPAHFDFRDLLYGAGLAGDLRGDGLPACDESGYNDARGPVDIVSLGAHVEDAIPTKSRLSPFGPWAEAARAA